MSSSAVALSEHPDDIWDLFTTLTEYAPPEITGPPRRRAKYQLLEVLVARLMWLMRPDFQWQVTRVSGDGGMDFMGRFTLFDVPEINLQGQDVLLGQCKRTRRSDRPGKILSYDLARMSDQAPTQVIIAYAGRATPEQRAEVIRWALKHSPRAWFLGLDELDFLIRRYLPSLREIIERALPNDAERVLAHFGSGGVAGPRPLVRVTAPTEAETGRPFEVVADVTSTGAPLGEIRCVWDWPSSEGEHGPVTTLRLITPSAAAAEEGLALGTTAGFESCIRLKLVGYRAGLQPLGELVLHLQDGKEERVALGTVEMADQYHPPFFTAPFKTDLNRFEDVWRQARSGHLHVVNVVGAGGAGKTRLCQEFGYRAEQDGGRYLFREHPKGLDQPYSILCDVLRALVPGAVSIEEPGPLVLQHLRSRNPELAAQMEPTIELLYNSPRTTEQGTATFDGRGLVRTLCLFLLDAARRQPLLLHVSECHWAQTEALDIFGEVVQRLREVQDRTLTRIVFVFEGREHEALPAGPGAEAEAGTVAWERFLVHGPAPVRVQPLTRTESEAFLESLFESTQAADRRVHEDLIPHQETLVQGILRFAEGNPFHMIEQLRLLLDREVVVRNERTGLLYLGRPLDERYDAPESVVALIQLRYEYLRRRNPAAALLLAACAFLRDRLPRRLYVLLKERLAPGVADEELLRTNFLQRAGEAAGGIWFRHENYYAVTRALELDAPTLDRVAAAYLEWLDTVPGSSAQELFDRGQVHERAGTPDPGEARRLYEQALGRAENDHQPLLSTSIARRLLPLVEEEADRGGEQALAAVRMSRDVAWLLVRTGSWSEAERRFAATIDRVRKLLEAAPWPLSPETRRELEYSLYRCMADRGNVHISLMQPHEAISRLTDALPVLALYASTEQGSDWPGVYLTGANRLGVAHWFDGRRETARRLFRDGFRESRRVGDLHWEFHNLLDLATLSIHRSPHRAAALLTRCMEMLDRWPSPASPRLYYLTRYQRAMAELVRLAGGGRRPTRGGTARLRELHAELEAVHTCSRRDGYVHEEAGAALMAGACSGLLGSGGAPAWFMHAIAVSARATLMEFAWKAHLNLAQLCLDGNLRVREGAGQHAEQAERMIRDDLERRRRDEDRRYRLALYELPMAQLARVWRHLGDRRASDLLDEFPHVNRLFHGGEICPDRHERQQVLHVTRGPADLFLMS